MFPDDEVDLLVKKAKEDVKNGVDIEAATGMLKGPNWDREEALLKGLKEFRKFYEKWYGFAPPPGAVTFWEIGWEMCYDQMNRENEGKE